MGDAGTLALGSRMSETLAHKASAGAPRDVVASRPPSHLKLVMATQDLSEISRATSVDRSQSGGPGGNMSLGGLGAGSPVGAGAAVFRGGAGATRAPPPRWRS